MTAIWSGSAGEAACREREKVDVLKIEEHSLSDLARRTERVGGYMGYRLFCQPQILFLCVIVFVFNGIGVMRLWNCGGCESAGVWISVLWFCVKYVFA